MPLIELHNLVKTYHLGEMDVPVLKGISMTVKKGELVALTGSSGSGKSTLMNILGCLDHPTSGSYRLGGREIADLSSDERAGVRSQMLGFVFQNFNLLPRTTALDNVTMPLTYAHADLTEAKARQRGKDLLARVDLADRAHHHPSQLSGGQQQRVAIARALVNSPELLFADEPTGNLDSHMSAEILQMFRRLNREEGLTIIIVTHDPEVAASADRTIKLRDGLIDAEVGAAVNAEKTGAL